MAAIIFAHLMAAMIALRILKVNFWKYRFGEIGSQPAHKLPSLWILAKNP